MQQMILKKVEIIKFSRLEDAPLTKPVIEQNRQIIEGKIKWSLVSVGIRQFWSLVQI